jgi:hypothetical protein
MSASLTQPRSAAGRERNNPWEGANAPFIEEILMALYELRTYTLRVGAMAEAVKLYQELG